MTHHTHEQKSVEATPKPKVLKVFLWFTFSGTAMLSAFILPIHLWALATGSALKLSWWIARYYFLILTICALYHGLYRTKTILFDLGVTKGLKVIGAVLSIVFVISVIAFAIRLFS